MLRNRLLILSFLPPVLAAFLGGCITDGPNQSGAGFLEEQGISLTRPLDSVTFTLTADSIRAQGVDTSVAGGSSWLVGRRDNFTAVGRIGFFVDSGMVVTSDSLKDPNYSREDTLRADSLHLSLTLLTSDYELSGTGPVALLVQGAAFKDSSELNNSAGRSFFETEDSLDIFCERFAAVRGTDTIQFMLDTLVPQKFALPNIFQVLQTNRDHRQFLFLQISSLDDSSMNLLHMSRADTLFFGSMDTLKTSDNIVSVSETILNPEYIITPLADTSDCLVRIDSTIDTVLAGPDTVWNVRSDSLCVLAGYDTVVTGDTVSDTTWNLQAIVENLTWISSYQSDFGLSRKMVTYMLFHPDFENRDFPVLLTGKTQGLHIFLDRDEFITKIMEASSSALSLRDGSLEFNDQYFIPYARMTLPLISGPARDHRLDIILEHEIDSVFISEGTALSSSPVSVAVGSQSSPDLIIYKAGTEKAVDSIGFEYLSASADDKSAYQLIIDYSENSNLNDTVAVYLERADSSLDVYREKQFEYKHFSASTAIGQFSVTLTVAADTGKAEISYHFEISQEAAFSDSSLGVTQDFITLNAADGIQNILNRVGPEQNLFHDFFVRPRHLAGIVDGEETAVKNPVFYELPPALDANGHLPITFNVYFYKL